MKLVVKYIYKENIKRVWDIFREPKIFNEIIKKFSPDVELVNGRYYSELGTIVRIAWKGVFEVYFETTEIIDKEFFKKMKFYSIKVSPVNYKYSTEIYFYWNSLESYTLLVHELVFEDPEALKLLDVNHNKKERLEMLKLVDEELSKRIDDLIQIESILIKNSLQNVWNVVTNWKLFQIYVPMIGDKIEYDGKFLSEGTQIYIQNYSKKSEYYLRVVKCIIKDEDNRSIVLEYYHGKPAAPRQELHFDLKKINKNSTFLSFQHKFKEPIKYDNLKLISKEKIGILTKLKNKLEK